MHSRGGTQKLTAGMGVWGGETHNRGDEETLSRKQGDGEMHKDKNDMPTN